MPICVPQLQAAPAQEAPLPGDAQSAGNTPVQATAAAAGLLMGLALLWPDCMFA